MVIAKDKNTFQVNSSWLVTRGARRVDLNCSELSATFDFASNYRILLRLRGKNEQPEDRGVTLLTVDLDELLELLGEACERLNFDMVEYRDTVVKASSQERLRSDSSTEYGWVTSSDSANAKGYMNLDKFKNESEAIVRLERTLEMLVDKAKQAYGRYRNSSFQKRIIDKI